MCLFAGPLIVGAGSEYVMSRFPSGVVDASPTRTPAITRAAITGIVLSCSATVMRPLPHMRPAAMAPHREISVAGGRLCS